MEIQQIIEYLKKYDGPQIKIMEVCGTHTASIFKNGIRNILSKKIKLISGPGCPVCVTPSGYIDCCIELAMRKNHILLTFGDMIKVPGSEKSLAEAKGDGANIEIMYSPNEAIEKAKKNPHITYIIAAVGFETTIPTYGLLLKELIANDINNVKFITALKRAVPAIQWVCENDSSIEGYLCPGHVSTVIGSEIYEELANKYKKRFIVTGFEAEHIITAIYYIVRQYEKRVYLVKNLYKNAVSETGNIKALEIIDNYFEKDQAYWRGLGVIDNSGMQLKKIYRKYDAAFDIDIELAKKMYMESEFQKGCQCGDVIIGKINPDECRLFKNQCTPTNPCGPCMVSSEGACGIWFRNI